MKKVSKEKLFQVNFNNSFNSILTKKKIISLHCI